MEEFTASNGWTVTELDDGQVSVTRPAGNLEHVFWIGPTEADTLREYFRAEADAELGRWRWPENPDYVVYRTNVSTRVRVLRETGVGELEWVDRGDSRPYEFVHAARAYFDAHPVPEPRPWENAQPGEIWRLTTSIHGDYTAAVIRTHRGDDKPLMFMPVDDPSIPSLGLRAPIIVTAVRWPEGETTT